MALDYVKVSRVANLALPKNTVTSVVWDTEDSDTAGYFALAVPSKIVVPTGKAGKFVLSMNYSMDGNAPEERAFVDIQLFNSSNVQQRGWRRPIGIKEGVAMHSIETSANDADYFSVIAYQNWSNGTRNFVGQFELLRLG